MKFRELEQITKELEKTKEQTSKEFKKQNEKERNGEPFDYTKFHQLCDKERELQREYEATERYNVKIGDGVTIHYYSDSHAGTVIDRTKCSITIQLDKATLKDDWKPEFIPGGFAGHCINQEDQEYVYERDDNGRIYTAYWSKVKGRFVADKCLSVSNGRQEYYDYNF